MSNNVKRAHKNLAKRSARKYPSENNSEHASIKEHFSHATIYAFEDCARVCVPTGAASELVRDKGRIVPADRAILPIPLIMEEFQPFAGQLITSRVPSPP